jgi:hypothetical protein
MFTAMTNEQIFENIDYVQDSILKIINDIAPFRGVGG